MAVTHGTATRTALATAVLGEIDAGTAGNFDMLIKFVTAKLKNSDGSRQGVVISVEPLILKGVSGKTYKCEGLPILVDNPPSECMGCDLPLGSLCVDCESQLKMLTQCLEDHNLSLTQIDITPT